MSSSGSGERVVGEREGKDVVSSGPPAARTRAQNEGGSYRAEFECHLASFHHLEGNHS